MPTQTAGMSDPTTGVTTSTDALTNMFAPYDYGTTGTTDTTGTMPDFSSSTYDITPPTSSSTDLSGYTGAAYPGTTGGGFGNLLSSLFGGGGTGGGLGGLLGTAVNYGVPLYEAAQQKKENEALAGKLTAQAQPLLTEGQRQLAGYQTLTPLQQQALDQALKTGQTTAGRGQPLIDVGTTGIGQYQRGELQPWQQAELDRKVAQQKALTRQSLGANVDSTTLAQMDAQIDAQAQIAKGQMINANLATAEATYGQGVGYETAGGTAQAQAYRTAVSDVNQNLQNAINTITTGLGPLENAIRLQIAGNTEITKALANMYGALAKASATGGGTAAGGGAGGVGGLIGKGIDAAKKLFGGGGAPYGMGTGTYSPALEADIAAAKDAAATGATTDPGTVTGGMGIDEWLAATGGAGLGAGLAGALGGGTTGAAADISTEVLPGFAPETPAITPGSTTVITPPAETPVTPAAPPPTEQPATPTETPAQPTSGIDLSGLPTVAAPIIPPVAASLFGGGAPAIPASSVTMDILPGFAPAAAPAAIAAAAPELASLAMPFAPIAPVETLLSSALPEIAMPAAEAASAAGAGAGAGGGLGALGTAASYALPVAIMAALAEGTFAGPTRQPLVNPLTGQKVEYGSPGYKELEQWYERNVNVPQAITSYSYSPEDMARLAGEFYSPTDATAANVSGVTQAATGLTYNPMTREELANLMASTAPAATAPASTAAPAASTVYDYNYDPATMAALAAQYGYV